MLFLNPWLLLGLAGVSIPVLIHLVRQQATKPVDWGAMRFLFDTISVRRRKMEWEDLLLMAARCLLLGLVALAIARPFVTPDSGIPWLFVLPAALLGIALLGGSFVLGSAKVRWITRALSIAILLVAAGLVLFEKHLNLKRFEASGRRDVALVIDASSSMEILRDGKTGFEIAIAEARRVVNESPRGTAFAIILGGPAPEALTAAPLTHRADVLGVLGELMPIGGIFRAHDALSMATLALSEGKNASKEILVFTDSQRASWRLEDPAAWRNLEAAWKTLPNQPKLILRSFGTPENFRNLALNDFELSRPVIGTDREVVIRAQVENTGTQAITPGPISLEIGGSKVSETSVGLLLAGQTETIEFRHRFTQPGPQLVQLRIDAQDDLEADNRLDHVINVRAKLPVLLVEGNPSGSFFERASGYSALALAPSQAVLGGESSGKSFLMDPRVVNATALRNEDIEEADVIILADVQRLPAATAQVLARKIAEGAGLITIAGPRIDPDFYNEWEGLDGAMIPMKIGAETTNAEGTSPALSTFHHEALQIFSTESDLKDANITRWRKTTPLADRATQAAAFNNGDAFIAARNYGKGRSLLVTAALDARAGGLPAKRSFVPLIHELTLWTAGQGTDLNVEAMWNPVISLKNSAGGLLGEYFRERDAKNKNKARRRVDPTIDFNWGGGAPMEGLPTDQFSIRWTGFITAPVSGLYRFSALVDDKISVKVGDHPEMKTKLGKQKLGELTMEANQPLPIVVEFNEEWGEAKAVLYWTPPGDTKEIIPPSAFFPGSGNDGKPLAVTDPRGAQRNAALRYGRRGQELAVDGSAIPGVYLVTLDEETGKHFPDTEGGRLPLVVKRDASESRFEEMTEDDFTLIRSTTDLVLPESVADVLAVMDGKGFGREIWKLLAIAALILFVMESVLARWVSRSRRIAEDARVEFGDETSFGGGFR